MVRWVGGPARQDSIWKFVSGQLSRGASLAIFAAIRRASSFVSSLAADPAAKS